MKYPPPSDCIESEKIKTNRPCGRIKKNQNVTISLVAKNKVQIHEGGPSDDEPQSREENEDQEFRKRRRLLLEDQAKPLKTSQVTGSDFKSPNIVQQKFTTSSVGQTRVQICDSMPSCKESQSRNTWSKDPKLRNRAILIPKDQAKPLKTSQKFIAGSVAKMGVQMDDNRPSCSEPQGRKNGSKDLRLRKRQTLVLEEEAKPSKTSRVSAREAKSSDVLEEKVIPGSVAKTGLQICDSRPPINGPQSMKNCDKYLTLVKQHRLVLENEDTPLRIAQVLASDPQPSNVLQQKLISGSVAITDEEKRDSISRRSGNEPRSREKCDKDLKLKPKQRLLLDSEEAETLETSQVVPTDLQSSNILEYRGSVEAQLIIDPIWKYEVIFFFPLVYF